MTVIDFRPKKNSKEKDAILAAKSTSDAFAYTAAVLHNKGLDDKDILAGAVTLIGKCLAIMDDTMTNTRLRDAVVKAITRIQADQILEQLACDLVDFDNERDRQ